MAYRVSVYSFTKSGYDLAEKICCIEQRTFRCEKLVFELQENGDINSEVFSGSNAHVFIGAVGIAVRKIAEYIGSKFSDPAVIVIDEKGEHVIPVLSGHVGGANALAEIIADYIGGNAIITTATDVNGYNAIDKLAADRRLNMHPEDAIRYVNAKMLKGETIKLHVGDDIDVIGDKSLVYEICDLAHCDISIYNNKKYVIGVGCRKNIDDDTFENVVNNMLFENNILQNEIDRIVSIDIKKEEKAILNYSVKYDVMFETYSADELNSVDGEFDESDFVKSVTGVSNVSERSAVFGSNMMGQWSFVVKRKVQDGVTISICKVVKGIDLNGKA